MAVNADVTAGLYREHPQAQFKSGRPGEFGAQVYDCGLAGGEPFIALWRIGGDRDGSQAENR